MDNWSRTLDGRIKMNYSKTYKNIDIAGHQLEYYWTRSRNINDTELIFLHDGLGSAELWRDFPEKISDMCGLPSLVYSRYGYGNSEKLSRPRKIDYMHFEALEVLPTLRKELNIKKPILIGHSDGASIALIHAGANQWPVKAMVIEAPHVFVENRSIAGIERVREDYIQKNLRAKLLKYHRDPDSCFYGWNDIWLDPKFRSWNIENYLRQIGCPTLVIQGDIDEFGTTAQVDAIKRQLGWVAKTKIFSSCGHSPHKDHPQKTLNIICKFLNKYLDVYKL